MQLSVDDVLPDDRYAGTLVGRVWIDAPHPGPRTCVLRDGELVDLSGLAPTLSALFDLRTPAEAVRDHAGARLCSLEAALARRRIARSLRSSGGARRGRHLRHEPRRARDRGARARRCGRRHGIACRAHFGARRITRGPGAGLAPRRRTRGASSFNAGSGRSTSRSGSVRTPRCSPSASRCRRSAAAPRSACIRARSGTTPSPRSCWPYRATAASWAPRSATTSRCATSRAAARCCCRSPRTTTRPVRSVRSSDCSTTVTTWTPFAAPRCM